MHRNIHTEVDLHPLVDFYKGMEPPEITPLSPEEISEPFRSLLVHDEDMTPTLERFHGSPLYLVPLNVRLLHEDLLARMVTLNTQKEDRPVEFGAIKIHLSGLEREPRRLILEGYEPLGAILRDWEIGHTCRPSAYFKVFADWVIRKAFSIDTKALLYGRRNTLFFDNGDVLAEVVEILPPRDGAADQESIA